MLPEPFSAYFPVTDPTWIFFIVLSIILLAPMLLERLRVPAIIGMIFAGVLIGPYGLHLVNYDSSFELFGKVGLYYIMFLASLEMKIQDLRALRGQALTLGLLSFGVPLLVGWFTNHFILGFTVSAAVLMACMYSSHTLISYPIVIRYGIARMRSVGLAVGATIVADTLTLLVLAVVGGMYKENVTGWYWVMLTLKVVLLSLLITVGFPWLCRWFFRRWGDSVVQYIFVLALLFLGAGLMEIVGMEGILGAFLVGLVLGQLIPPGSPLMNHIEFVGNALFIPYLLIGVGMKVNIPTIFSSTTVFYVSLTMIVVAMLTKWGAAALTARVFRMKPVEGQLMFGLTSSRAAATLAVALVGHEIILPDGSPLLNDTVFNGAMMLILFSCLISGMVTDRSARRLALTDAERTMPAHVPGSRHLLIALSNPQMVDPLMQLGIMLQRPGRAIPATALNVVLEDRPEARGHGMRQLERAVKVAASAHFMLQTQSRWSVNVTSGIYHAMLETDSTELLLGLHHKQRTSESFFGKLTTDLLQTVHRQITVYHPVLPLNTLRRMHILVPHKAEFEAGFAQWVETAGILAENLSCRVELYSSPLTMEKIKNIWARQKFNFIYSLNHFTEWNKIGALTEQIRPDHLLMVVGARHGTLSYHSHMELLPRLIERFFNQVSLIVVFPDQYELDKNKTAVPAT